MVVVRAKKEEEEELDRISYLWTGVFSLYNRRPLHAVYYSRFIYKTIFLSTSFAQIVFLVASSDLW